jgi:hypothetical protein
MYERIGKYSAYLQSRGSLEMGDTPGVTPVHILIFDASRSYPQEIPQNQWVILQF